MAAARFNATLSPDGRAARGVSMATAMAGWSLLALAPDADVLGFLLGVPYGAAWGHRGATHSLAIALAAGGIIAAMSPARSWRVALLVTAVIGSHGLLDALTDGGLGAALFWPLDDRRYFAPWTPLPVSPIGLRVLSPYGLSVALYEIVIFSPLFAYALWPRRVSRARSRGDATTPRQN